MVVFKIEVSGHVFTLSEDEGKKSTTVTCYDLVGNKKWSLPSPLFADNTQDAWTGVGTDPSTQKLMIYTYGGGSFEVLDLEKGTLGSPTYSRW